MSVIHMLDGINYWLESSKGEVPPAENVREGEIAYDIDTGTVYLFKDGEWKVVQ